MKVVHVGFPKTATTWLQRHVFPLIEDYGYVGPEPCARLFDALIHHDDTLFDLEAARRAVEAAAAGLPRVLFSYEALTGLEYRSAFVNRTPIARRLRALGFERAIITIRNQFDVLESAYKQYVASGGVLELRRYVSFDPAEPRYLYPEYFEYDRIYRLYAELFGKPNVLVLEHERLREPSFLGALFAFLETTPVAVEAGARANPSLSGAKTRALRVLNHFTYSAYRPSSLVSRRLSTAALAKRLARLPFANGRRSLLDARTREEIRAFYAESNGRLERHAGITLSDAYPLAARHASHA